jgi:hypothetical protein
MGSHDTGTGSSATVKVSLLLWIACPAFFISFYVGLLTGSFISLITRLKVPFVNRYP